MNLKQKNKLLEKISRASLLWVSHFFFSTYHPPHPLLLTISPFGSTFHFQFPFLPTVCTLLSFPLIISNLGYYPSFPHLAHLPFIPTFHMPVLAPTLPAQHFLLAICLYSISLKGLDQKYCDFLPHMLSDQLSSSQFVLVPDTSLCTV